MATNDDEIEELKRLIEEERQRGRAAQLRYRSRPEIKQKLSTNEFKRRQLKLEAKAGRLRPLTCEVCGKGGRIVYDHSHKNNKFRGWLCLGCNLVLGNANDDPVLLEKLAVYLRTHNA